MGGGTWTVVRKVLLPEALPSLVAGLTTTVVALIGYSAMAGAVGGGGLGDLAIRYGYQRFETDMIVVTVALLAGRRPGPAVRRRHAGPRRLRTRPTMPAPPGEPPAQSGATTDRRTHRTDAPPDSTLVLAAARRRRPARPRRLRRRRRRGCRRRRHEPPAGRRLARSRTPRSCNFVKDNLADDAGLKLEVVEFTDYVQPNIALDDGSRRRQLLPDRAVPGGVQTQRTATDFVRARAGAHRAAGPLLEQGRARRRVPDGATVAIPNDATNDGRALRAARGQRPDHAGRRRRRTRRRPLRHRGQPEEPGVRGAGGRAAAALAGGRRRRGDQRQLRHRGRPRARPRTPSRWRTPRATRTPTWSSCGPATRTTSAIEKLEELLHSDEVRQFIERTYRARSSPRSDR